MSVTGSHRQVLAPTSLPQLSAGPGLPHVSPDHHCAVLLHPLQRGVQVGRKRDSRETRRVPNSSFGAALPEAGASSLNAPCSSPKTVLEMLPTSPFTLTHSPGGPSHLPHEAPPTLLVLRLPLHQGPPSPVVGVLHSTQQFLPLSPWL